jgi:signal peptidase I
MDNSLTSTGVIDPVIESEDDLAQGSGGRPSAETSSHEQNLKTGGPIFPPKTVFREYFESIVITVIIALFGMTFIVQAVKVPTGSMQNTINIGDHLLVNKFGLAKDLWFPFLPQREITRGDVIVFKYPGNKYEPEKDSRRGIVPYETNYVKRVIGLPGDVIEIDGTSIKINGVRLRENIVVANDPCAGEGEEDDPCHKENLRIVSGDETLGGDSHTVFYEPGSHESTEAYPVFREEGNGKTLTVPKDSFFVMGDNRDNSEDSRFWGFVNRRDVVARAMFVYWSYDEGAASTGNPILNFFENSRWQRTLRMIK